MAYIRSKIVKGHKYYQVVESYRDKERSGKPRQRVLHHLGKHTSIKQKLQSLRRKEAGERRAAATRFDEVTEWVEKLGRQIVESQEGPLVIRKPVDDPVYSLVEKAIAQTKERLGLPEDRSGLLISEWNKIFSSVAKQTGLRPSEVESRWRGDANKQHEEYLERILSVGQQSMPSEEETLSKHRDLYKKFRKWEKERDAGRLTPEEVREGREQIDDEWSQGLYIAVAYHNALDSAREHEARSDDYQAQINELLEIQQKYF